MTDTVSDQTGTARALRRIVLIGPTVGGKKPRALWTLEAGAPHFGYRNAIDGAGGKIGEVADHVHPLRVLVADQADAGYRRARLIDLHLVVGVDHGHYAELDSSPADALTIALTAGTKGLRAEPGRHLRTVAEAEPPSTMEVPFVRVVAEPMLAEGSGWPVNGNKSIAVPPLRLLAGQVGLDVDITGALSWLGKLVAPGENPQFRRLRLVPDGIEFDALLPMPGSADMLKGRVLLSEVEHRGTPRLALTLLGPAPGKEELWRKAWELIAPADSDAQEALLGLKLRPRRSGAIPAFRWLVVLKGNVATGIEGMVHIPPGDLQVSLVSPPVRGEIDGVADLATGWISAEPVFKEGKQVVDAATLRFGSKSDEERLELTCSPVCVALKLVSGKPLRLALDSARLSRDLRAAYGLATPPSPASAGKVPASTFARPLLPAFVPLTDGWLQLPIPNLAPVNTELDADLAVAPTESRPRNAFEGYLRFKHVATAPAEGVSREAPWVVTVERASGVEGEIKIGKAQLREARFTLIQPTLSTRGLLWASTDRPDAAEALPRLGAGPGMFIDLVFATGGVDGVLSAAFETLSLSSQRIDDKQVQTSLDETKFALDFLSTAPRWTETGATDEARAAIWAALEVIDGSKALPHLPKKELPLKLLPAVVWRRHPVLPLAATMSMTRAAAGGMRPLESRDLIPFRLPLVEPPTKAAAAGAMRLASFVRAAGLVFVALCDNTVFAPLHGWPSDAGKAPDLPERGIAFAALGMIGVEVRLAQAAAAAAFDKLEFQAAVRYDLPPLDEAFATVPLPPVGAPAAAAAEERDAPQPDPVPTLIDWALMGRFWEGQERKHQNARVVDSYLAGFAALDVTQRIKAGNLIRHLDWDLPLTVSVDGSASLPFGTLTLSGKPLVGNDSLMGYDTEFTVGWPKVWKRGRLTLASPGAGEVAMIGFAPGSIAREGFDGHFDNSLTAAGRPVAGTRLLSRPVALRGGARQRNLVSLLAPLDLTIAPPDPAIGSTGWRFWFKDVLFADSRFTGADDELSFRVWDDDDALAAAGFEWRLLPADQAKADQAKADEAFRIGRNELPLFGFQLEPLRLVKMALNGDEVASATLLCRLSIGSRSEDPSANLVFLEIKWENGGHVGTLRQQAHEAPLRYVLDVAAPELGKRQRRVVVEAVLDDGGFSPRGTSLSVEVAGIDLPLGAPTIKLLGAGAGPVEFSIAPGLRGPTEGGGLFTISEAKLTVDTKSTLSVTYNLTILPQGSVAKGEFMVRTTGEGTKLNLCGKLFTLPKFEIDESSGALAFAWNGTTGVAEKPGVAEWNLSLGGALRLGTAATRAALPVLLGRCKAQLYQLDQKTPFPVNPAGPITITAGRVDIDLTCDASGTGWSGNVRVHGDLCAVNAIKWPSISETAAAIPLPEGNKPRSGRVRIKPGEGGYACHMVTWLLAGHTLPYATATAIVMGSKKAVWTGIAAARHSLTRIDRTLCWTGIEPFTAGSADALVPPPDPPEEATIFAARYQANIEGGRIMADDPGMVRPGEGKIGTVLQGALGTGFRRAFWQSGVDRLGLVLVGGFLGMLQRDGNTLAPLLRLPVLAGIAEKIGQDIPEEGIELAWVDGPAARLLAVSRPSAVSPASAAPEALRAAMIAGSRPFPALNREATPGDPRAALLVEQSFATPLADPQPSLEKTPFFLAAAVGVEQTWQRLMQGATLKRLDARALSLVAAVVEYTKDSKTTLRPLAAAILTQESGLSRSAGRPSSCLFIVGEALRPLEWTRPTVVTGQPLAPLISALAVAADPMPRAALFAELSPNGRLDTMIATWPSAALDVHQARNRVEACFADSGRGPIADPGSPDPGPLKRGWLVPPLEGPTRPIRDAERSGIGGLARRIALQGHARPAFKMNGKADTPRGTANLVWLAQGQVPVYLPLAIHGLRGPVPAWLVPASPRVRLPTDLELDAALVDPNDKSEPVPRCFQPFLPDGADIASVGERAGVMTVRRIRLLSGLPAGAAFDAAQARFGRPAQAGSSFARKFRTPRPGPLPPNLNDSARNRRIQASPLRFDQPFAAFIGSADTVRGVGADGRESWSITVIAAPEQESIVDESWDGAIRLHCRIETSDTGRMTPNDFLRLALLQKGEAAGQFASRAILKIGTANPIDYETAVFTQLSDWQGEGIRCGAAAVELRAGGKGAERITEALTAGPLPPVELQWTVHPSTRSAAEANAYSLTTGMATTLPEGRGRAPLTLRLPLYPVSTSHGALPLTPATLIFCDPAYDRDLTSLPLQDDAPLKLKTKLSGYPGRGDLRLIWSADRSQVNCKGTVTLMLDVRFERPMSDSAQARSEAPDGGDLCGDNSGAIAVLAVGLQGRDGRPRWLKLPNALGTALIVAGRTYELAIATLREEDGTPARIAAGDTLLLRVALTDTPMVTLWNPATSPTSPSINLSSPAEEKPTRTVRLTVTDDSTASPPPALYAVLLRTQANDRSRIAVPLHAQSPLPWRIDLVAPALDFRRRLMRRTASFVWTLMRPRADFAEKTLYILKMDRNGQTYLPKEEDFRSADVVVTRPIPSLPDPTIGGATIDGRKSVPAEPAERGNP